MLSRRLALLPFVLLGCGSDDAAVTPPGGNTTTTTTTDGGSSTTNPPGSKVDGGEAPETFPDAKGDPCRGTALSDDAVVASGLCVRLVAKTGGINGIRQIMFASNGDLFGQRNDGGIVLLRDEDGDGSFAPAEIHLWAASSGNGNNAHIDEAGGYIYAGSAQGVSRFKYDPSKLEGGPDEEVVTGQPYNGHPRHTAHVYDGFLYVSSGSAGNETHEIQSAKEAYDTKRSLVKRFDLSKYKVGTPFNWDDGEVFTVGLRNANGFTRNETTKKIYAVVNGLDNIVYKGVDIHSDNPGEQIAEIAKGNAFGYPYCFTAQAVDASGIIEPGTQLFHQNFAGNPHNDEWCKTNSMKPTTFVTAHSAPLDLAFFDRQAKGNLPEKYRGGAFVAQHGSWNRPSGNHVGRSVVWVPFNADGTAPMPTTKKDGDKLVTTFPGEVIFGPKDGIRKPNDGSWVWSANGSNDSPRPSGVAVSPIDGSLYIASDNNGTLYRVGVKK